MSPCSSTKLVLWTTPGIIFLPDSNLFISCFSGTFYSIGCIYSSGFFLILCFEITNQFSQTVIIKMEWQAHFQPCSDIACRKLFMGIKNLMILCCFYEYQYIIRNSITWKWGLIETTANNSYIRRVCKLHVRFEKDRRYIISEKLFVNIDDIGSSMTRISILTL